MRERYVINVNSIYRILFLASLIGICLILYGHPSNNEGIVSMGTLLIAFSNFTCFCVWLLTDNGQKRDAFNKFFLIFLFLWCLIAVAFTGHMNYGSVVSVLTFMQLPIYVLLADRVKVKNIKKYVYIVFGLFFLYFVNLSHSSIAYRYKDMYGYVNLTSLTLGYNNPNETAIYLFVFYIILLSGFFYFKKKLIKIMLLGETVYAWYLILLTECRTVLLLSTVIGIISFITKKIKITPVMLRIVFVFPIIFTIILIQTPEIATIQFLGDNLDTGRYIIFSRFLRELNISMFLFGDFASTQFANMHNAFISIVSTIGILGLLLFLAVMYGKYKELCNKIYLKKDKIVIVLGLLSIILYSSVEAALLVSGSIFATLVFILFVLYFSEEVKDIDMDGEKK